VSAGSKASCFERILILPHYCHAIGCSKRVPPRVWSCRPHWFALPKAIRDKIWEHYRPGQEITKTPTREYMYWFYPAQAWLAAKEGQTQTAEYAAALRFITRFEATASRPA
jgi:hypothetical protein